MNIAMIVAAGNSHRFGSNKLALHIDGETVLRKSLLAFDRHAAIDKLILVCSDGKLIKQSVQNLNKPIEITAGGAERQDSVKNGLAFVADDDIVLIHDGARPFVTAGCISRSIAAAQQTGSGVCGVPVYDTLKQVDPEGHVMRTLDRRGVYAMQTPQGFVGKLIKKAHATVEAMGTDDASLLEAMGEEVTIVMGDKNNIKLTVPADIPQNDFRVGQGYDVHRLGEGEELILCGEPIPYALGLIGHSDADVATHALMDAILGALGERDIGHHFPDSDNLYQGISSLDLLAKVMALAEEKGYRIKNCDITIMAQQPKLAPYIEKMRENLIPILKTTNVNIKATTTEHCGFVGRNEGMESSAVVLLLGGTLEEEKNANRS